MDDEHEAHGPRLPPWHSDWQKMVGELQYDIAKNSSFFDYPRPVRVAVLRKLLGSELNEYERSHFEQLYESGELEDPNDE